MFINFFLTMFPLVYLTPEMEVFDHSVRSPDDSKSVKRTIACKYLANRVNKSWALI